MNLHARLRTASRDITCMWCREPLATQGEPVIVWRAHDDTGRLNQWPACTPCLSFALGMAHDLADHPRMGHVWGLGPAHLTEWAQVRFTEAGQEYLGRRVQWMAARR